MKKAIFKFITILGILYIIICGLMYFLQEKIIFFPEKLNQNYAFGFKANFEELSIRTNGNVNLHGILFKADSSKGLIFYLHGNAGSLRSWGQIAENYTDLEYDLFMLDYRGYGKSGGRISSQNQLFNDIQIAYDSLKTRYEESGIIILGYSIGTGPAAKLASANHPKMLILQAPYYSLEDLMMQSYPLRPTFLLKYKLETKEYIRECTMPIVIFHGDLDEVIYYNSSVKLKECIKATDTLITLTGQRHNGMTDNPEYLMHLKRILKD